jgi:hypothetical protein
MDPVAITVRAVQGGWTVESVLLAAPLMFLSGARAERQAHRLAQAAIDLGRDVRLAVHDKVDALIALIDMPAATAAAVETRSEGRWEHRRWRPKRVAPFANANWRELVPA